MSENKPGCKAMFFRGIPEAVRNRFKAYCSRRGTNMTKKLEELMRACIKEDLDLADDLRNFERSQRT